MKEKLKVQKGITLIALVITIIILLILTAVSIGIVSDGGIISRAKESKETQIVAQEKELMGLAHSEYKMSKISDADYTMQEALDNAQAGATAEGDEILGWTITFEKTSHQYTIYGDGTIYEGIPEKWDGTSKEKPTIAEDNSWHIYNCAQMKYFADFVNGELTEEEKGDLSITEDTVVYLEANLDLGARANADGEKIAGTEWMPIGATSAETFVGTFEGNNHYITGIYVNIDGNFGGIFGNSNTIKNLTIVNSYIEAANGAGGIVGALRTGDIANCHNINTTVIVEEITSGGVVGQLAEGTFIKGCTNTGNISATEYVGGVLGVGYDNISIEKCNNDGNITGKSECVGGIIGLALTNIVVADCNNTGNIIGEGERVGGIAGNINNALSIKQCYNTGNVSGKVQMTGGIIGFLGINSTIEDCNNEGQIIGDERVGGIVGNFKGTSSIKDCDNKGSVTGSKLAVGGVTGLLGTESTMENCKNTGDITGGGERVGGVSGNTNSSSVIIKCNNTGTVNGKSISTAGISGYLGNDSQIENCYNTGNIIGEGEQVGGIIGLTVESATNGTIENNYNSGKITGTVQVGGIIGKDSNKYVVRNCYNKGEVIGSTKVGAIIGEQVGGDETNIERLYYLESLNINGIGNVSGSTKTERVSENLNSFDEFLNWIQQK